MKEEAKKLVTIISNGRLSATNAGMLYSFMIKRISKGYSTAEVSFLMGYTNDYLRQKEELKTIGFSFEDIQNFTRAIEESPSKGFIPGHEKKNHEADYQLIKTIKETTIDISMFRTERDQSRTQIFHLIEENPGFIRHQRSFEENAAEAKTILNVLFDGPLFYSPQSTLKIYQQCRTAFGTETLQPRHVQAALLEMTKKKTFPKLNRVRSKDYGNMYEKIFE